MYDSATVAFIQGARPLPQLDLNDLPRQLTDAYTQIVAARMRLAEGGAPNLGDRWNELSEQLSSLAATHEVITLVLPTDHPQRASTAFVAASAHHAMARADALGSELKDVFVDRWTVAPSVTACLLYTIAGHQADAAELAKTLSTSSNTNSSASVLVTAIAALCSARGEDLRRVIQATVPKEVIESTDDSAVIKLMHLLHHAIQTLAAFLLGETQEVPFNEIDLVINYTTDSSLSFKDNNPIGFHAPGVRHLALLLRAAATAMVAASVVSVPPPSVDAVQWSAFLRHYAAERPLLWRNHVSALSTGLLETGRSCVMSFPTGAGKSALAEFRAAAETLRGCRVIYLAPTRALVSQIQRQMKEVLTGSAARVTSFLGNDFPDIKNFDVAVMTPEACLVLASANPKAIEGTGLLIFDECHMLCGAPIGSGELPSRRSIDANLALLEVVRRCPAIDVMLLSAMVANATSLAAWLESVTGRPCFACTDAWKPTRQIRGILGYNKEELIQARTGDHRECAATPWGVFCHKQVWDINTSLKVIPMLTNKVPLKINSKGYLMPNRNVVGGHLGAAMAHAGIRPLVFVQDINGTSKTAKTLAQCLPNAKNRVITFDAELMKLAAMEVGSKDVYDVVGGCVGRHHALLLPSEVSTRQTASYRWRASRVRMGNTLFDAHPTPQTCTPKPRDHARF